MTLTIKNFVLGSLQSVQDLHTDQTKTKKQFRRIGFTTHNFYDVEVLSVTLQRTLIQLLLRLEEQNQNNFQILRQT